MTNSTMPTNDRLRRPSLERCCWFAAAAGIVLCAGLAWRQPETLWRPFLFGLLSYWLVAVGSAGLLALGNVTGGAWAMAARPYYVATMQTMPYVAFLCIAAAFGLGHIYPWATASASEHEGLTRSQTIYLAPTFFFARGAGYLTTWLFVSWVLHRASRLDLPPASTTAMRRSGALSLVLLVPTVSFAAFDWAMSLEAPWYSSIYGALLAAGGVVAAHALAIVGLASNLTDLQPTTEPDETESVPLHLPTSEVYGDLGNLLLAFVMLSTYFAFSQFLIIWSGNLPSEITWYERRLEGGWAIVGLAVAILSFAAPFLLLLSRDNKRTPAYLATVAALVIVAYAVNMYWTIVPSFAPMGATDHLLCVFALIAVGGVGLALSSHRAARLVFETRAAG